MKTVLLLFTILISSHANAGTWLYATLSVSGHFSNGDTRSDALSAYSSCLSAHAAAYNEAYWAYKRQDNSQPNTMQCQHNTGGSGWQTYARWVYATGTCPASLPHEWDDGVCRLEEQAPQCPSHQFVGQGGECISYCEAGFDRNFVTPLGDITTARTEGVCAYTYKVDQELKDKCNQDLICNVIYTQTGEYIETGDPDSVLPTPENVPFETTPPSTTEEYSKTPEIVTTDEQGTVTTEFTENTTKLKDAGTTVTTANGNIYITNSSGEIIGIEKQHAYNSYTDGSSDFNLTEIFTSSTGQVERVTHNPSTGTTTTETATIGRNGTITKTTVTTYDSSGEVVSSNSTTQADGDNSTSCTGDCGDGDGDGEGGKYVMSEEQGDYIEATSQIQADIESAKSELEAQFYVIKGEIESMFNFNQSTAGALPCPPPINIQLGNTTKQIEFCLTDYESELSIIAIILIFVATFLAIAIILR